jgi:hypothetical protein
MDELHRQLTAIGLQEYLNVLVNNGFTTWQSVSAITERDLDQLGFKLGHRRALQRKIAEGNGYPKYAALPESVTEAQSTQSSGAATRKQGGEKAKAKQSTEETTAPSSPDADVPLPSIDKDP